MTETSIGAVIDSMDPYEKLILYGAGALGKDLKTKVKMQKLMFFCTNALPEIFGTEIFFEAHEKGPYSEEIEERLLEMEDNGLIVLPDCSPTEKGREVCAHITPKEPVKSVVENYKEFITGLTEDELLTLIYVTFPDYQKNSEEWGWLRAKRADAAVSMLSKQVISFSKALEIADLDQDSLADLLKSKNIRWRDA